MLLPSLPNLVSTGVELVCPWTFAGNIPAEVRGKDNKKKRSEWIESAATQHNVYSGWEGFSPNLRISSNKGGNAPFKLLALVGDYDAPSTPDEILRGCERLGDYIPNYYEHTLSGYGRFVWLLEQPITVPSREFAVALLKFLKKRLKPELLSVGLDEPAWNAPERYYTNACSWKELSADRLPKSLMDGWVMQVAEDFSFKKTGGSIAIPLEIAVEELKKRYPSFDWPGDFALGSQGPSFWIEGSASPKSALVKAEGLYTFSAHAVKPWWSWKDLLGAQFVEAYETKSLGEAVEGIFYDGKAYWRQNGPGKWCPFNKEDTAMHLHITRGLSNSRPRGGSSDVDRALEHIRHWAGVIGAAPFVFRPPGIMHLTGDQRVLNTFTRHVVTPAPGPVTWGSGGPMPFLSEYIGGFFDPVEQLDYFLAWLQRFYASAHELKIESGQNIFIAGQPGIGKTLLSTQVIAKLVGGHAAAENYLMGKTDFNSQLFETALWTVDDTSANDDLQAHKKFSTIVKRMAANTTFEYHAKFQVPCQVRWQGRVVVTCNTDEESIRIIPDLDVSILDKIMIFRAADRKLTFPPSRELEATIEKELPYLARYLLDWQAPAHTRGSNRFGVASYHEESLVKVAKHSSRSNSFLEILEDWKKDYFAEHKEDWQGTAYQLLVALHKDAAKAAAIRSLDAARVNQQLSALKNKGYDIHIVDSGNMRYWRIPRPVLPGTKSLPVS
jgi:hypothetical protein